jgi:hypothetical protein
MRRQVTLGSVVYNQGEMYMIPKIFKSPLSYIHNRWVCPRHKVTIRHPSFIRGQYHDTDHIMLYVLFQMLVDFVEIECGSRWGPYHFETNPQKINRVVRDMPVLRWFLPPSRNIRQGLHHLRWAMKLKDMPSQAQQARDVFTLYKYWTRTRPARIEPFTRDFEGDGRTITKDADNCVHFSPEYSAYLDAESKLEDNYHQQDQEMLQLNYYKL